ncbi:MAG: sigma-70 family RNA polymerase sigma factor [Verrucomicrobiales bacterium]|nr:sigma-70 family RNA polymerase sigma factor [Verrucomicrobiae bacterium]
MRTLFVEDDDSLDLESSMSANESQAEAKLFPPTRWSLVAQSSGQPEVAAKALSELCQIYWYPVYAFVRTMGKDHHDAEDLTQGFFAHLLGRGDFSKADRSLGKLRSFLCITVKRYVISNERRDRRFKRGGHVRIVSLDAEADERRFRSEPSTSETPETLYERRWASTLLSAAIDRLKVDYEKRNQAELLTAMLPYLSPNAREDRQTEIAEQFGMATGAFRMNVHRMRQRYNEFLRAIIADTVEDRSEIDEELAYLLRLFQ